jgi:pimeloyl-ACP methyl ester carboxylesterase
VQREVSHTTRVCAYDRAGMGWSEVGPDPRDARQITGELHALLKGAGIEGPYAQTYATRYPDEVAGVALIGSSSSDQFGNRPAARDG